MTDAVYSRGRTGHLQSRSKRPMLTERGIAYGGRPLGQRSPRSSRRRGKPGTWRRRTGDRLACAVRCPSGHRPKQRRGQPRQLVPACWAWITGEPGAVKAARPVREGGDGKVVWLAPNQLAGLLLHMMEKQSAASTASSGTAPATWRSTACWSSSCPAAACRSPPASSPPTTAAWPAGPSPDPERAAFDQVVLTGCRRARAQPDPAAEQQIHRWAEAELRALSPAPTPLYTVPATPAGELLFSTRTVDPLAAAAEARRTGLWTHATVTDALWPPETPRPGRCCRCAAGTWPCWWRPAFWTISAWRPTASACWSRAHRQGAGAGGAHPRPRAPARTTAHHGRRPRPRHRHHHRHRRLVPFAT